MFTNKLTKNHEALFLNFKNIYSAVILLSFTTKAMDFKYMLLKEGFTF